MHNTPVLRLCCCGAAQPAKGCQALKLLLCICSSPLKPAEGIQALFGVCCSKIHQSDMCLLLLEDAGTVIAQGGMSFEIGDGMISQPRRSVKLPAHRQLSHGLFWSIVFD